VEDFFSNFATSKWSAVPGPSLGNAAAMYCHHEKKEPVVIKYRFEEAI